MTLAGDLKRTMEHPRHWSDEQIETAARRILAEHPPEQDDTLDPETRGLIEKCRVIFRRRDTEPTALRMEK